MWRNKKTKQDIIIQIVFVLLLCQNHVTLVRSQQEPAQTPCPHLFNYGHDDTENLNWMGIVNLDGKYNSNNLVIDIILDRKASTLQSKLGTVTTTDRINYQISDLETADTTISTSFTVIYKNPRDKPRLQEIQINNKNSCRNIEITTTKSACKAVLVSTTTSQQSGTYEGYIRLIAPKKLNSLNLDIIFNKKIFAFANYLQAVTTADNTRFNINKDNFRLKANEPYYLKFFIKFDEIERVPDVDQVLVNGINICTSSSVAPLNTFVSPKLPTVLPTAAGQSNSNSHNNNNNDAIVFVDEFSEPSKNVKQTFTCGKPILKLGNRIKGGIESYPGQFPWHVAIYVNETYICGGSLISEKSILTAAHCLTQTDTRVLLQQKDMKIYVGLFSLSYVYDNELIMDVGRMIIHTDYNPETYTSDIGLIILKEQAMLNDVIKPICLETSYTEISSIYSRLGTVPGWGYNEKGYLNNNLSYINMPIVPTAECIEDNPIFNTVLKGKGAFCTGYGNGHSVCNGDSGGGLFFTAATVSYLRGIVSISAKKLNEFVCDADHHAVFTDVSFYLPWIRSNLE